MKININKINRLTKLYTKDLKQENKKKNLKKYLLYTSLIGFPIFYIFYIMNSSGLFKKLNISEKYKQRQKQKEKQFGIDQEKNDKLIDEFEKKYDINYSIIEYEKRIKFGNKELNLKEEVIEEIPQSINPNRDVTDPTKVTTSFIFDDRLNKKV